MKRTGEDLAEDCKGPVIAVVDDALEDGSVTEHLATEQPQVLNNRPDLVVRTEDGAIHQVAFQTRNAADFRRRIYVYYAYLYCAHR